MLRQGGKVVWERMRVQGGRCVVAKAGKGGVEKMPPVPAVRAGSEGGEASARLATRRPMKEKERSSPAAGTVHEPPAQHVWCRWGVGEMSPVFSKSVPRPSR